MLLDPKTARIVYLKVSQVQEEIRQYIIAPGRRDLRSEEFQRVISDMYKIRIEKFQVAFEGEFLRGMMLRYVDRAIIYVKKNMEEDWKRFISVKELCHVMIDEREDWSPRGTITLRRLISDHRMVQEREASKSTQSETFAELAAIELLFPIEDRMQELGLPEEERSTNAQLSNIYKIPEVIVEKALTDEYIDLSVQAWGFIGRQIEDVRSGS